MARRGKGLVHAFCDTLAESQPDANGNCSSRHSQKGKPAKSRSNRTSIICGIDFDTENCFITSIRSGHLDRLI
jgi:hypothetical protein